MSESCGSSTRVDHKMDVPMWERPLLTVDEAAAYTHIGKNRLRELSDDPDCRFVLFVGSHRLLKRKELLEFISSAYSI